ncbi:MAG: ribosome silencing factor [Hyphomicrobium sp.]
MIQSTTGGARKRASTPKTKAAAPASAALLADIVHWLDEAKAEEIVDIPLEGKSSLGDYMVVATGRTDRHVGAIADQLATKLKEAGLTGVRVEGLQTCDWVLVDAGDIIVHVFRPEVREFYNLEKMWKADPPPPEAQH